MFIFFGCLYEVMQADLHTVTVSLERIVSENCKYTIAEKPIKCKQSLTEKMSPVILPLYCVFKTIFFYSKKPKSPEYVLNID